MSAFSIHREEDRKYRNPNKETAAEVIEGFSETLARGLYQTVGWTRSWDFSCTDFQSSAIR